MIKDCKLRHKETGNCIPTGGFCTANEGICEALQSAYRMGYYDCTMRVYEHVENAEQEKSDEEKKDTISKFSELVHMRAKERESAENAAIENAEKELYLFLHKLPYDQVLKLEAIFLWKRGDFETEDAAERFLQAMYPDDDDHTKEMAIQYLLGKTTLHWFF